MKYIFTATGGSGTTFFIKCLGKRYRIDSKPDTYFAEKGQPYTQKGRKVVHQFLSSKGFDELPIKTAAEYFFNRTGFKFDLSKTIARNIFSYIEMVKNDKNRTVLFNTCAKFDFFSDNEIEGLVCLIRHPLHAYLSYTKKERHYNLVKEFGGPDTFGGVEYFARSWISNVSEVLKLKEYDSRVLRYEFLKEDAAGIPEIDGLFNEWRGNKKNKNTLSEAVTNRFKEVVLEYYFKIYDEWDL